MLYKKTLNCQLFKVIFFSFSKRMAQQEYSWEERTLLWHLYSSFDYNNEDFQDPREILKSEKIEYKESDLKFWIARLENEKLIQCNDTNKSLIRITPYEGVKYIKEHNRDFQDFIERKVVAEIFGDQFEKDTPNMIFKHALSTEEDDGQLTLKNFYNQGLIGYISKFEFQGLVPLYQILIDKENDYFCFIDKNLEELSQQQVSEESKLGFLNNGGEGTKKLFRFFNKESFDHFYCTTPNRTLLEDQGYIQENINGFQSSYLYSGYNETLLPLYVYSKTPETLLFTPLNEKNEDSSDQIEYISDAEILPDTIAKRDDLGRKNLMEIVFNKINTLWSGLSEDQSFTILLNGEWGSGKSSMLSYLEDFLKDDNWSVVQYNAWEHQRFDEPWWILVNKVSKEVPQKLLHSMRCISRPHWVWKTQLEYSLMYIGAFIISILLIIGFTNEIFGDPKNISFIASVLALIGSLWFTLQGTLQNIFRKKSLHSVLHSKNANDPLEPYKKRFKKVVKHKKVAIFIDDLDRCEVDATVSLLEGIQTLFKSSKVLYVIAADGHWVSTCFDKKYDQFNGLIRSGQTIGNQFLQKTFQLIVDVPKLNKPQQQSLLNKYLNRSEKNNETTETTLDVIKDIEQAETLTQLGNISAGSGQEGTRIAAQKAEQIIKKQKEHYTQKLLEEGMMPQNPRQMIRLINLFTLKIQELIISEVLTEVGEDNALRYILFSTEYPEYNYAIRHLNEINLKEKYPDIESKLNPLSIEMLKTYF